MIGKFLLVFVPLTLAMDAAYIATMTDLDAVELTEAGAAMFTNIYTFLLVTMITTKRAEWKALFVHLYSFTDVKDKMACQQLKLDAKFVKKLSATIATLYVSQIVSYLAVPVVQRRTQQKLHPNETLPPLFIYHHWYPYDKTQSPYYEISLLIECVRLIGSFLATGLDCLCTGILIYIIGQFKLLQRCLRDMRRIAVEQLGYIGTNIDHRKEEEVERQMETLLHGYVSKHNKLIRYG